MKRPVKNELKELLSPLQDEGIREVLLFLFLIFLQVLILYPGSLDGFFALSHLPKTPRTITFAMLWHHFWVFLLFFIIPLLLCTFVDQTSPREMGLTTGDWEAGLRIFLIAALLITPALYLSSRDPSFRQAYPLTPEASYGVFSFVLYTLAYLPYYIGWECLYRGYIQFRYEKIMGLLPAIFLQTGMSTLVHWNKPFGETLSAAVGGIFLGLLAWRTRSIFWGLLWHWYLGVMNSLFCAFF